MSRRIAFTGDGRNLFSALGRIPFTLLLLAAVVGVALWTEASRESLATEWLRRLGFAASDLWLLDFERFLTSAVATHGGPVFCRALLAIGLIVGAAELRAGTLRTVWVFSLGHVLTLIGLGIFVDYGLSAWHPTMAEWMSKTRDVGPSAGYFACLALLCRTWVSPWQRAAVTGIAAALVLVLLWTLRAAESPATAVAAALAHVLAFPFGWVLSKGVSKSKPDHQAPAASAPAIR